MVTAEQILQDYISIYDDTGKITQELVKERTDYGYGQVYKHFDDLHEAKLCAKIAFSDYTSYSIPKLVEIDDYREPMREMLEGCERENGKVT